VTMYNKLSHLSLSASLFLELYEDMLCITRTTLNPVSPSPSPRRRRAFSNLSLKYLPLHRVPSTAHARLSQTNAVQSMSQLPISALLSLPIIGKVGVQSTLSSLSRMNPESKENHSPGARQCVKFYFQSPFNFMPFFRSSQHARGTFQLPLRIILSRVCFSSSVHHQKCYRCVITLG
jgi:hypothetical protein